MQGLLGFKGRRGRWASIALVGVGLVLLGLGGSYYGYTFFASRNLDRLVYHAPSTSDATDTLTLNDLGPPSSGAGPSGARSGPPPQAQLLYPGALVPARQWGDLRGTLDLGQDDLLAGFTPVEPGDTVAGGGSQRSTRLLIPAVDIEATVEELEILDLGDSRQYETPKFTVGHIPVTSDPGGQGNGWYFGHLESPLQGEGNVFSRLPKIPDLLRDGEDVYVVVESVGRQYLYQVTDTDWVHQDDLTLYRSDDAQVTLVTCFPRLKYDLRLLVTAKLVGVKYLSPGLVLDQGAARDAA